MAADPYVLRPLDLDPAGLAKVTALLREVFPEAQHFTEEVIRWQYLENPDGKAVGYNAWAGEELAGHYVTIPLRVRIHGQEERCLLSLNTATHPAHRGKGLFTRLATATYQDAARAGYGSVFGVANANSAPGFTGKLGFLSVGPLRAMVGVGPIPFRKRAMVLGLVPIHSAEKLAWRVAHPVYRYSMAEQDGHTLILSQRTMKGARFLLHAGKETPKDLPLETPPRVKAFIGLDPRIDWRGSLYVNVPMRFRPSPLYFIFKDLTGNGRTLRREEVCFQAFDFDTL